MSDISNKIENGTALSIDDGVSIIKQYVATLPLTPGVYRMISSENDVLYVGKAKALKKRVASYTKFDQLPNRLKRMVSLTVKMEFVHTHTEAEALILEANLIKKYKPRYNILLRDDKSFPYIVLRENHDFPQILKYRGAKTLKGEYFGPFPSVGDVNRTLNALQKVFLLRNCSDNMFEGRSRPCLQYHIKRCTAPCVDKVTKAEYAKQVLDARAFIRGESDVIRKEFTNEMQKASESLNFERAASYRDRISALSSVQAQQDIDSDVGDVDVVVIKAQEGVTCIQVFFFRSGRNMGNKSYFPRHDKDEAVSDVLSAFIAQFYVQRPPPKSIVTNIEIDQKNLMIEALSLNVTFIVTMSVPQKGKYKRILDFCLQNVQNALKQHLALSATRNKTRQKVAELFDMDDIPKRIEVYDNSHISGTNMVGAMIVEGEDGFMKNAYRLFTIKEAAKSDDYGMMREVFTRRFKHALEKGEGVDTPQWPDLVLIDGGLGQLSTCTEVLEELGILDTMTIVGIAKGVDRNAGREKFFMNGRAMFQLPEHDPVLQYLQRLRDEAHRFAIGAHRAKRSKAIHVSSLDHIDGIGAKRKKSLLLHFGSAKAVEGAAVDDLMKVEGISRPMAQKIYDFFH